jgi:hypothetical protein
MSCGMVGGLAGGLLMGVPFEWTKGLPSGNALSSAPSSGSSGHVVVQFRAHMKGQLVDNINYFLGIILIIFTLISMI